MAEKPITSPLPADLPENWVLDQIVSPNGAEAGLDEKHGYNYLAKQVNTAQRGVNTLNDAMPGKADLVDGKVPAAQLPKMDYIPTGEKGVAGGVATLGSDGKVPTSQLQASAESLNFGPDGTNGLWDRQTGVPTGTQSIRYNGYLRATRVYGMYYSDSADYAEAYAVEGPVEPGDLVMICGDGVLRRNTVWGNARVVGIVSTAPATVIGAEEDCTTPIAMAGRVPVRTVGEVRPGDFLMGSGIPGALERADGNAPRGAIVAQALEAKADSGERLVLALVVRL